MNITFLKFLSPLLNLGRSFSVQHCSSMMPRVGCTNTQVLPWSELTGRFLSSTAPAPQVRSSNGASRSDGKTMVMMIKFSYKVETTYFINRSSSESPHFKVLSLLLLLIPTAVGLHHYWWLKMEELTLFWEVLSGFDIVSILPLGLTPLPLTILSLLDSH